MTKEERAEIVNYVDDMHKRAQKIRVKTAMRVIKDFCTERIEANIGCRFYSINHCLIHNYPVYWGINEKKN